MVDVNGTALNADDRELMAHPMVGGVILFARNYESKSQVSELCRAIREACPRPLIIAVDQEGGRVQRLTEPFTRIPPMRAFGRFYDEDPSAALERVYQLGQLLGSEIREVGIDFSFTPVLDLDYGQSSVIGDRAFHASPEIVAILAGRLIAGLKSVGVAAVAKHFPGHGGVAADSHLELPVDQRSLETLANSDVAAFVPVITQGVGGVMPAHVVYSQADSHPAGFSAFWLQSVLRDQLSFTGAIFSDDLEMAGVAAGRSVLERAEAATASGCDMLLVCNNRSSVLTLLDSAVAADSAESRARILAMRCDDLCEALDTRQRADIRARIEAM